jgi:hypothetical protein
MEPDSAMVVAPRQGSEVPKAHVPDELPGPLMYQIDPAESPTKILLLFESETGLVRIVPASTVIGQPPVVISAGVPRNTPEKL